ncbi:hypothetical protein RFI_33040, partial [Reticulomyxa filosa]
KTVANRKHFVGHCDNVTCQISIDGFITTVNCVIQKSQNTSIYAVAIKKCSELKQPNAFHQIIKLIHQKNISLSIIFCNTVLHYLGFWNKLDLQKKLFEQWFICKQFAPNTAHLDPDEISLNEMIKGCSKRGDVKQALYYFELPNVLTCNTMLSVCANACDMESAELIWNTMRNDPEIKIDLISINCMLNVYSKCQALKKKMIDLLNYSQQTEHFIPIDDITCTTVMSGLLKDNKIEEMFDFCQNKIPKLSLKNNINGNYKRLIELKGVGHLKMMEILNENEFDKLLFHHRQFINVFL